MGLSVKVIRGDEIRRFQLEEHEEFGLFVYDQLAKRVVQSFPDLDHTMELERHGLRLTWKDEDGDFVTLSNDSDLWEALQNIARGQGLRVYLVKHDNEKESAKKDGQPNQQQDHKQDQRPVGAVPENGVEQEEQDRSAVDPTLHRNIYCDGCHDWISGIRYKCLICEDYDLCSDCINTDLHNHHSMIRITSPKDKSWKTAFRATQRHGIRRKRRSGSDSRSRSHSPHRRHSPFLCRYMPPMPMGPHGPTSVLHGGWSAPHGPRSVPHGPWSAPHGPFPVHHGPVPDAHGLSLHAFGPHGPAVGRCHGRRHGAWPGKCSNHQRVPWMGPRSVHCHECKRKDGKRKKHVRWGSSSDEEERNLAELGNCFNAVMGFTDSETDEQQEDVAGRTTTTAEANDSPTGNVAQAGKRQRMVDGTTGNNPTPSRLQTDGQEASSLAMGHTNEGDRPDSLSEMYAALLKALHSSAKQ